MLKILYTATVIIINVVYYFAFGYIINDLGLNNSNDVIYNGAIALLFFNSVTFLVSLYFFKKATERFKFFNRILYTVLILASAFPLLYTFIRSFS